VLYVSIWGLELCSQSPRGDGTERTGQKSNKMQIILFFLQAYINECSSCCYSS